jgi:hypothetical protein
MCQERPDYVFKGVKRLRKTDIQIKKTSISYDLADLDSLSLSSPFRARICLSVNFPTKIVPM